MREINDFIIRFESERVNERARYFSQEGASVTGLIDHMRNWETKWRKENNAFSEDDLKTFENFAYETSKDPERQRIANEAINYYDTMSKSSKEAESVANEDTDYLEELEEMLLNLKE
jgi:hypothetical protein